MKETGKEHAGITFVVVYSSPPSTQVISVQVDVDFRVAGSIEAAADTVHRSRSISNPLCLQAVYHSPAAPPTMASWLLVGGPSAFLVTFIVIQFSQLLWEGCLNMVL